jgi:multiple sugar transport system permease protein
MKIRKIPIIRREPESIVINLMALVAIIFFIFPILWQLLSSLKSAAEVTANPPIWFFTPTLENWYNLIFEKEGFHYLLNSIIVASGTTGLSIALGSLAALGLSRFKFKGRDSLALDILSFKMFPPIVLAIPLFIIFQAWGLKNSYIGLILAHTTFNLPFTIWLLRGFFMGIPNELEEASLVDGCTRFGFFWRILLPLSGPGVMVSAVFCFILSWNEFMLASVVSSQETRTLPVFSAGLLEHYVADWGLFAAACILTVAPMLVIAIVSQKHLIKGLTYGAIKG